MSRKIAYRACSPVALAILALSPWWASQLALAQVFTEPSKPARPSRSRPQPRPQARPEPKPQVSNSPRSVSASANAQRARTYEDPAVYCSAIINADQPGPTYIGQPMPLWVANAAKPTLSLPQPTIQTNRPKTYVMNNGNEFIFCLARRFDVDVVETLKLNGLTDSEILSPGFVLKIPQSGHFNGPRALKAHPATYIVQSGDTIYSIACLYGDVDPMNIAAVNGLVAPYSLTVGAQIQIP